MKRILTKDLNISIFVHLYSDPLYSYGNRIIFGPSEKHRICG